jgi:hypothetical protein
MEDRHFRILESPGSHTGSIRYALPIRIVNLDCDFGCRQFRGLQLGMFLGNEWHLTTWRLCGQWLSTER